MTVKVTSTSIRIDQREKDLQDVFENWNDRPAGVAIAGRPRNIAFSGKPTRECVHSAWGYRPRADIVGDAPNGQRLIIELKLGAKYEPLGLVEVLFHAERLKHPERRSQPVLVTQYNLWNRVVIHSLRERTRDRIVEYYEVTVVDVERKPCFWFDAPLDDWKPATPPPEVIDTAHAIAPQASWWSESMYWYHVEDTGTYYALPERCDQRPAVVDVSYLTVAPLEGAGARWIAWAGTPPAVDAASTTWPMDQYWIGPG